MRLLQVVHQYPPERLGGTELCTRSLARELAKRGHSVLVFTRSFGGPVGEADDGVEVVRAAGGTTSPGRRFLAGFHDPDCLRLLEDVLDRYRPDLVHVQHMMGIPLGVFGAVTRLGVPIVLSLHDYWWFCPNAQLVRNHDGRRCLGPTALACARCAGARLGRGLAAALALGAAPVMAWRRKRLAAVAAGVAAVIAPSRYVLEAHSGRGFAFQEAEVLPHGIEAPTEPASPPLSSGGPLRLLYVGGLSPQKGVHVLVEALKAPGLAGAVELEVVGGEAPGCAEYAQRLRAAAAGLPVRFRGQLPHAEARRALQRCHALAIPSLWPETFAMVMSEAFAAGRPVLASRIGALAERVRHGQDGLLVEPGDVEAWRQAICILIADRDLLPRLAAGVRPPLTLAEHASAVEALYERVVAGVKRRPEVLA